MAGPLVGNALSLTPWPNQPHLINRPPRKRRWGQPKGAGLITWEDMSSSVGELHLGLGNDLVHVQVWVLVLVGDELVGLLGAGYRRHGTGHGLLR